MSKVWFCATCGYEVGSRGRCHSCGVKLALSPLPELKVGAEDDEVGYRLDQWSNAARGRLIGDLIGAGIRHRFEEDELVIEVGREDEVDALVGGVSRDDDGFDDDGRDEGDAEGPHDLDDGEFEDRHTRSTAEVAQLEAAAERLSIDPTDMEADAEVAEASTSVFMLEDPPWADLDTWAAVGRVTRRLMAALGSDEALEDEIRSQAGILARLLDPIVHPEKSSVGPVKSSDDVGRVGDGMQVEAGDPAGGAGPGEPPAGSAGRPGGESGSLGDTGFADRSEAAGDPGAETPDWLRAYGSENAPTGVTDGGVADDEVAVATSEALPGASAVDRPGRSGRSETVYELGEWLPEQRAELAMLLDREQIANNWDHENLVVTSDREADVERVLDRIEAVADPDADEEATYRGLEELFAATDRLVGSPNDRAKGNEVVRAAGVADGPTPVGLDDAQWWQIRQRVRILADSIEHKAQTDVVAGEARTLRDLLRDLV